MLSRALRAVLPVLIASMSVIACAHPVTDFNFQSGGKPVPLLSDKKLPTGAEGSFLPSKTGLPRTALFTLKQPEPVTDASRSFSLRYVGNGKSLELHVFVQASGKSDHAQVTAALPVTAGSAPVTFLLPLPPKLDVTGFEVTSADASSQIRIAEAGLLPDFPGVKFGSAGLLIRDGVGLQETRNGTNVTYDLSFTKLLSQIGNNQAQLSAAYSYSGPDSNPVLFTVRGGGSSREFRLYPQEGEHTIYFYTASVGFTPEQVTIATSNPDFTLSSVEDRPFAESGGSTTVGGTIIGGPGGQAAPIPANFGTMLTYDPAKWRNPDYEVFSWNLVPSVLVFDFRSLAVQARFLKRLAFFVEKTNYAGKLWPNFVISPLHGWNAHDYRPKDLAEFFTDAQEQHFPLNPEEVGLQDILVANGIIVRDGNGFSPGTGAIIGFSYEGPYWLRYLLLTHEGYHGIYFTHPDYRNSVHEVWNSLPAQQQDFWKIYLGVRGYDAKDDYLVINEFQAYLMQQRLSDVNRYYLGQGLSGLDTNPAFKKAGLGQYIKAHPDMFRSAAARIQQGVHAAAGVYAGELVSLVPVGK